MTMRAITGGAIGVAMVLGLSACTNPYDPAQRFVGGGLMGAATGAAIGAAAAPAAQRTMPPLPIWGRCWPWPSIPMWQ